MNPRSVAIIGASANEAKFGSKILECLVHQNFRGAIYPINPNADTLRGLKAYPSIADVPESVDVAVIAVPAGQLLETVRECANAGVGACVIPTAQTAEYDTAGERLQHDIVALARSFGMRLVGPNCLGFINPAHQMALTPSGTMLFVPSMPVGGVGLVSQSGALMASMFMVGYDHGVNFSRMLSIGNQADLDICDFFEALVEDAATRVICLYVEGLLDLQRFQALAHKAQGAGKPVLAVKAGRTASGQAVVMAHTASVAGPYDVFQALCESSGVILLDAPEAMVLVAGALERLGHLAPGGIAMMVSSGGGGAVMADRLTLRGLPLVSRYGQVATETLRTLYQDRHIINPIDIGTLNRGPNLADSVATVQTIVADDTVAGMLFLMTPQPFMAEMTEGLVAAWKASGKPVLIVLDTGSLGEPIRQQLISHEIPFVTRVDDAIRVLEAMFATRGRTSTLVFQ